MNYSGTTTGGSRSSGKNLKGGGEDHFDLVSSEEESENWRGIGIALLVIVVICSLIALSILLLTPRDKGPKVKSLKFELDEVLNGSFKPRLFNGSWITDNEIVFQDGDGALVLLNALTLKRTVVVSNTTFRQYNVQGLKLSANRQYVLMRTETEKVSEYSYVAQYFVYNISKDVTTPLLASDPSIKLQYVRWGPSGSQLVYVYNNNIYYMAKVTSKPQPLTETGREGELFNGVPDWMYENSILHSNHAMWWSKDGYKLCYAAFDDSDVTVSTDFLYGSYEDTSNISPKLRNQRYAKPGTPVPRVSLWVVDLRDATLSSKEVVPPKRVRYREYYFQVAVWVDNHRLLVTWSSRVQNYSVVSVCSADLRWECEKHLEEKSTSGWVDIRDPPVVTYDGAFYFIRLPVQHRGSGTYRHVTMLDVNRKGFIIFLTHGAFDVTRLLAHRMDKRMAYYTATLPGKGGQQHLFGVKDYKSDAARNVTCYTCNLGPDCLYNDAIFSPNSRFYILLCMGPGVPRAEIWSIVPNERVVTLDENDDLKAKLDVRALPQMKTFDVPILDGYKANVRVFLPPGLCEEEIVTYPTVIQIDASPGSQIVNEKFVVHWGSYLSSKRDFIYITIDGRGSGHQGDQRLFEIFRRLGNLEVQDQLTVIRALRHELPFIDVEKICIWGWGYGGFVTAMALAADDYTLRCGMAVAPITSWRYYDAAFTERYMQSPKPEDNYIGYEKSNVNLQASKFRGKKFLLIHGTGDSNVRVHHSMMLIKALTEAKVHFQAQLYPDEDHSLEGVKLHFHKHMERFLLRCFMEESEPITTS